MTRHATLRAWLDARRPPVPAGFRPYVEADHADRAPTSAGERVEMLEAEATAALARARGRDASDRAGAFDLLAADAWATWAAEAALETDDPVAALTGLARRLSDPGRSDPGRPPADR